MPPCTPRKNDRIGAKEYLMQIRRMDILIESELEELGSLRDLLTRVTPALDRDGASGGGFSDKMAGGIARIIDLQDEINRNIDAYADRKAEALELLQKVKNPDHVQVLYKRYFCFKTFETIASEMCYSYRGICYLHGRALQEYEKMMGGGVSGAIEKK